ncbi:hypothetical protein Aple_102240 [Acrocarpospora pleiomorpha]|uniref:Uncharacterized protein n=1 Tax=Acrocarpospora pleiomorpha TaxID=90975 RepID=A0A5M3Y1Y3_9ACTN|nr:hypothetical protein [Acrocarpospora pleiomorpha]GES27324.1 hypothetical protein Aple_102240 [Acrocarpospora pleiomorpha]
MPGRKRGLAVDVLGLVVAVVVLAISAHDNAAGIALLDQVAGQALDLPIVSKHTENIRSKLKRLVSGDSRRDRAQLVPTHENELGCKFCEGRARFLARSRHERCRARISGSVTSSAPVKVSSLSLK